MFDKAWVTAGWTSFFLFVCFTVCVHLGSTLPLRRNQSRQIVLWTWRFVIWYIIRIVIWVNFLHPSHRFLKYIRLRFRADDAAVNSLRFSYINTCIASRRKAHGRRTGSGHPLHPLMTVTWRGMVRKETVYICLFISEMFLDPVLSLFFNYCFANRYFKT